MSVPTIAIPRDSLIRSGLRISDTIHYQLNPDELVQDALRLGEGVLSDTGALVISTGEFTGRSPKDRFIVLDEITSGAIRPAAGSGPIHSPTGSSNGSYAHASASPATGSLANSPIHPNGSSGNPQTHSASSPILPAGSPIHWNEFNQPLDEKYFDKIFARMTAYLNKLPELWIRDCHVCADPRYRFSVRVINEKPSNNLFVYNMFLRPTEEELENFSPDWQILSAPGLALNPAECGTRKANAVVISFRHKMILLAGTGYTGETKKAIFTILNYILPHEKNVLSMHCAANMGKKGDTAIFFGLSGTGKTTLSADPARKLIGDDEHGWTPDNIFNFEGGCYAKCISLKEEREPEIWQAIRSGALVENVKFFPGTKRINFDDGSITENTRVSYPLNYIGNAKEPSTGNQPENIFFLTCDAYGVLPPISRLNPGQAMYQFISGYTAKVAGTETGITEPKSTFSACFGAPFLPLHPVKYAEMLGRKMKEHGVRVWLVNTGWSGGPYLKGNRMRLSYTRAMITAALEGRLDAVEYENHPIFGMAMPKSCPGVPSALLNPRTTWPDEKEYDEMAAKLAGWFIANFEKYAGDIPGEVLAASPKK